MITSVKEILNFRYGSRFHAWDWAYNIVSKETTMEVLNLKPLASKHFKLVIFEDGAHVNSDAISNDVYCDCFCIGKLKDLIEPQHFKTNNLVCSGRDSRLSVTIDRLKEIKHLFKRIYYEAKDIECDWVTTIPMGTIIAYTLRCGGDRILHHINKPKNKTRLIGSAFGSKWPENIKRIKDRVLLTNFTQSSPFMDNMFCDPLDYFERLSDYKFFACPLGKGIQTPKICESILCETVPVVTNHIAHRELRDIYDLPLLIVDKWEDLTEELLNEAYESKFKHIDWQKEKAKFLVENFSSLLK